LQVLEGTAVPFALGLHSLVKYIQISNSANDLSRKEFDVLAGVSKSTASTFAAAIVEPANVTRETSGRKMRLGLSKCAIIPFNGDLK
jgi:predicted transcriptional regulator